MSKNDKLEGILAGIKKKNEPTAGLNEDKSKEESPKRSELQKVEDVRGAITLSDEDSKELGFIGTLTQKTNEAYSFIKNKKQLEAQQVVFDTQIERLKHQAEATERQSKAYWSAKSVDFSEGLKTYAQQNMQLLENARLENKSEAIVNSYNVALKRINDIIEGELPVSMKEELITKIVETRDETVFRIEEDILANKYDLGPGK